MPTPDQWLQMLSARLSDRQAGMALMESYYRGDHPLPFLTRSHDAKMRDEFRKLLEDSRSNFMRLVVDVVEERMRVEGFRLSASTDQETDQGAWAIWQANEMDAQSQIAFVESLVKGVSYLSVWAGDEHASIAVEDATQTIVGYEPGSNMRQRAAALKTWRDEWTGLERANVYLPDGIYKYQRQTPPASGIGSSHSLRVAATGAAPGWKVLESEPFVANPLGVVPIVPLPNRPMLTVEGESELADVYRIQNQINGFLFLLALAGYFGAHRQRWAVGLTIMENEQTGKPIEPFNIAVDRLLVSEDPNTRFGEFSQTDLGGYIAAIDQKIQHIATTTRTPRHYLEQSGQSPSGDAIKSAESGLVKKAERKQRTFGEGLEEAIRLARLFEGETDSPVDSEIVWADPETRTPGEITDAAVKLFTAGIVPWEQTLEDLGYTQTQIARMREHQPDTTGHPSDAADMGQQTDPTEAGASVP